MMQYYADDCYACDQRSKEAEWYRTKRNIFNGAFNDIQDAIFTFFYKLE